MKKIKQLLLVEDDPVSVFLVQNTLEETGVVEEIVVCHNGQHALDQLHNGIDPESNQAVKFPQVILLDLNIPVMNGYEFLEEYMQIEALKGKNIHVVILSSASLEREKTRIEHMPVSAYIQKPIDEHKITTVLSFFNNQRSIVKSCQIKRLFRNHSRFALQSGPHQRHSRTNGSAHGKYGKEARFYYCRF